jgi:toxin ParE1/3/4
VTKKHRVEIADAASIDIRSIRDYIAADNPRAADRWVAEVERSILRLETFPFAHGLIPEASDLGVEYRQKIYGNYRVIYRVEEVRVIVLRVIHGARLLDQSMFFD